MPGQVKGPSGTGEINPAEKFRVTEVLVKESRVRVGEAVGIPGSVQILSFQTSNPTPI